MAGDSPQYIVGEARRALRDLAYQLPDLNRRKQDALAEAKQLAQQQAEIARQAEKAMAKAESAPPKNAEQAKEQLSRHAVAGLHVPLVDVDLHVTREEFDKAAHPHIERTVELTGVHTLS